MRILGDWLKAYVEYNAFNETPDHFHFWTGVGVIGAALRRKVWLDMGYFIWTPNFYIVLVAPPGISSKSTAIGIGQRILRQVPGVRFGSAAITWQALVRDLQDAQEAFNLGGDTYLTTANLSFFISELGTCLDFADRKLVDTLVDLWDGREGEWERSTLMRGKENVINPWLTILGCTTPAWLSENMPRKTVAGGFSARCIWLFSDSKKHLVPYPFLAIPNENKALEAHLINDLIEIGQLSGQFRLSPDALALGSEWYTRVASTFGRSNSDLLNLFRARKQTHVHKLAMALSASRGSDMIITFDDLNKSIQIVEAVEAELEKVFHSIYAKEEMEDANEIVKVVLERKRIRKAELYQMFFHRMTAKDFTELLTSGIDAGLIHLVSSGATVWVAAGPHEGVLAP